VGSRLRGVAVRASPVRGRFEEDVTVDPETLLELYSTTSALAALRADERDALLSEVRALLAGPYRLPIRHELAWTRLLERRRGEPRPNGRPASADNSGGFEA
jgi:hypothetical protein